MATPRNILAYFDGAQRLRVRLCENVTAGRRQQLSGTNEQDF